MAVYVTASVEQDLFEFNFRNSQVNILKFISDSLKFGLHGYLIFSGRFNS